MVTALKWMPIRKLWSLKDKVDAVLAAKVADQRRELQRRLARAWSYRARDKIVVQLKAILNSGIIDFANKSSC
jgi:hypothetical protein